MTGQGEVQPFSARDNETKSFIPHDLKEIVLRIFAQSAAGGPHIALRELYERAEIQDPYYVASSVYDFLWKKVASESRRQLYPIVGDFFLSALEQKLGQIGPNNVSSRFAEIMECYKGASDVKRMIEGPLYCVDLFLLKTTQLALSARNDDANQDDGSEQNGGEFHSAFLADEKLSTQEQIEHSLDLAKDVLMETQSALGHLAKAHAELDPRYIAFARATLDRLTLSWQQWSQMHKSKDISAFTPEEYFKQGLGAAEKVKSLVLAAMLLEQVGEEYQDRMCREFLHHRFSNRPIDHPLRGCTFDSGEIYRDQGIIERENGAHVMSERRFSRAISLFAQLNDRSSVAHTLIERARLFMLRTDEAWRARADLHRAAQNIAAVLKRVPTSSPLPTLTPDQVLHFYEQKGMVQEAEIYRANEI
ncbi:MAG: hypothetical protein K1Y02_17390 [Candidatus Hydrogenedentes bacterium]|nr:hypothetical protein [Candidatus Hydrogenedentota bacterium]